MRDHALSNTHVLGGINLEHPRHDEEVRDPYPQEIDGDTRLAPHATTVYLPQNTENTIIDKQPTIIKCLLFDCFLKEIACMRKTNYPRFASLSLKEYRRRLIRSMPRRTQHKPMPLPL